jgi:mannose-1-phosphate guanylyltransferase
MEAKLHGVILAGVHRWQNSALEQIAPPAMMPVGDRTMAERIIEWIRSSGLETVSMCANSDTPTLRGALGTGEKYGVALRYYEDLMPRGPAGCMRDASLDGPHEDLVVVDASILPCALDLQELIDAHARSQAILTVAATCVSFPSTAKNTVSKPVGVYVVSRRALQFVPETGYQDIKQGLIPRLHAAGERVVAHGVSSSCPRVTDPGSYLQMIGWFLEHQASHEEAEAGYHRMNGAHVHESARLHADCRLIGRVHIGPRAVVEKGATIIGPTMIGRNCVVGEEAVISRSAVWNQATIGNRAVVDRCILANGANVEPGCEHSKEVIAGPHCLPNPPQFEETHDRSHRRLCTSVENP